MKKKRQGQEGRWEYQKKKMLQDWWEEKASKGIRGTLTSSVSATITTATL